MYEVVVSCNHIATTQHNAHDPLTMRFGSENEQRVGGRPGVMDFRPPIQSEAVRPQTHMMIGRCHTDVMWPLKTGQAAKGPSPDNRVIRLVALERWCSSTHHGRKRV